MSIRRWTDDDRPRAGGPGPEAALSRGDASRPEGGPARGAAGRPEDGPSRGAAGRPEDGPSRGDRSWRETARRAASVRHAGGGAKVELLRELLVFRLDDGASAIPVERVREIVRVRPLTRVPRTPDWLRGVMVLRGEVVEVVDLRRRLGLPAREPDRASRIVVVHGDEGRAAGLLVDAVLEVARVPEDRVRPAEGLETELVVELARRDAGFVSILDVERTLELGDA